MLIMVLISGKYKQFLIEKIISDKNKTSTIKVILTPYVKEMQYMCDL